MGSIGRSSPIPHPNLRGLKKSRNGCANCRRRRKKCDGHKPICRACSRLKLHCSYERQLNWSKHRQYTLDKYDQKELKQNCRKVDVDSLHLINFSLFEVSLSYQTNDMSTPLSREIQTDEEQKCDSIVSSMHLVLDSNCASNEGEELCERFHLNEKCLFENYREKTSCIKTFGECDDIPNDFRDLIVPESLRFPALYQVVLALSSLDLMKHELMFPNPRKPYITAYYYLYVKYHTMSINTLYQILDDFDITKIIMMEQLAITIVALCSSEISNKGNRSWVRHLKESAMIFSALPEKQILASRTLKFAYRYFLLRYILLLTTLKGKKMDDFIKETGMPIINSLFEDDQVNPMLGCSPKLIMLIFRITLLDHLQSKNFVDKDLMADEYLAYWRQIESIPTATSPDSDPLALCSTTYCLAAKLYFCMLIARGRLSMYVNFKLKHKILTKLLFNALKSLAQIRTSHFYPNWGIWILVSCQNATDCEELRTMILNIFDRTSKDNPLCSTVAVQKALETFWKYTDLTGGKNKGSSGPCSSCDPRDILEKYNYMLPLT